jgi:histidyl-tRNA synthetase
MVADLRGAGIAAEMYLGESGMKAQMKYADRRDAPLVVIQGGDEEAKGIVQIKDMREGKKLAEGVADHDTYREARLAQGEVPEADLVAAVARMLGRLS